jgi:2-polyprenyl-3-methyl-5-hydroxy-6-metoxy-1,4-benzoquinol methylase
MPSTEHKTLAGEVTGRGTTPSLLEHPRCAVCDSVATRPLVIRKGYQVVGCERCGLVYVSPRPRDRESIDALYTDQTYCDGQISHAGHSGRVKEANWRLDQVERSAPARGRLLDVGCSAASFLLAARDRGWAVAGLDISAGAIEYAKSVHGLEAKVGTLEDTNFPAESFDVVTLFECIEHMRYPAEALKAARRVLKKAGLLIITTPNIDGLFPRVTYRLLAQTIGAWEHPTPPHHLYQFSLRTLTALLENTGFKVMSTKTRPMGFRFTVRQMENAIIDALKRRHTKAAAFVAPPPTTAHAPRPASVRAPYTWRRAARSTVGGFCWVLSGALYSIPVGRLGLGDSMLVVARKP